MKQLFSIALAFLLPFFVLTGCGAPSSDKVEVNVSAAMSLKDVLTAIGELYEEQNPKVKLVFTFASSGTLQRQIRQGAPVDLFISADPKQVGTLAREGLVRKGAQVNLASNQLVLIVPRTMTQEITCLQDLSGPEIKTVSIGTPETVPAGQYARETLTNLGLWPGLASKLIYAKDVRQVLAYVETENVDAGIVYRSDAQASSKVRIVTEAPEGSHSPIIYPAVLLRESRHKGEGEKFLNFLQGDQAQKIFEEFGFIRVQ